MKCSEERPSCLRCIRAKFVCEGYGNFVTVKPHHTTAHVEAPGSRKPNSQRRDAFLYYRGLGALSGLSSQDSQIFDFCRNSTVQSLNCLEWSDFWCTVVPAAAHAEPAILHALLAVGAAHQVFSNHYTVQGGFDQAMLTRSYVHSSKAMRHLQRILKDPGAYTLDVTLMACYMLLIFECICGREAVAMLHLHHGRRIIRMIQSHRRPDVQSSLLYLPSRPETIEHDLIQAFSRMDVQAITWGAPNSEFQLVDDPTSTDPLSIHIPPAFESVFDASRYILFLLHEGTSLIVSLNELATSEASLRQTHLLSRLAQWQESCQCSPFYAEVHETPNSANESGRFLLLRIHHALMTLTATTCLSQGGEMVYDSLLPLLRSINRLASGLVDCIPNIGLDMAVIQPSILIAIRCRHPAIRRQALRTLDLVRKKGLWDTTLDIGRVEALIQFEEQSASYQHTPDVDCHTPLQLDSLFPPGIRISNVEASFADDAHTEIKVSFTRKRPCIHQSHETTGQYSTLQACGCEPRWTVFKRRHKLTALSGSHRIIEEKQS